MAGFGVDGELVSTGDNVYLSVFGDNYQLGRAAVAARREALSDPGLDPRSWFGPATYEGDEEVEGTGTARIDAPLRGARLAADLEGLGGRLGLPPVRPPIERGTIQAWIGIDDGLVRELRIDAGEDLAADLVLSEVGEPQEITIPAGGGFKPIGNLLASLQELGVSQTAWKAGDAAPRSVRRAAEARPVPARGGPSPVTRKCWRPRATGRGR